MVANGQGWVRALAISSMAGALAFGAVGPARVQAHSLPYGVALTWSEPSSSAPPVIVTNRGLVFPNGASAADGFRIRCNDAYGANTSDRPLAYLEASGNLTVGVYNRVFQTSDRGCTLVSGMGLPEQSLTSLLAASSMPQRMYVASRVLTEPAMTFASDDHGRTFNRRFTSKANEYYETIIVAPSDAQRLYALGLHYDKAALQVIFYSSVSIDGGQSWEDTVIPARITPFAVHPQKPDVVFGYRATDKYETNFDILRSEDRGKNYQVVLANAYMPTGFAAVGDSLYLGANFHGAFYRSRDDGRSFVPLIEEQIQRITCLAEHAGKLWLCANISPNLDGIWTLKEDASGVDKVMSFEAVVAPVVCSDSAQNEACAQAWHDFDLEVHPPPDSDAGASADAGTSGDAGLPDASSELADAEVEGDQDADEDDTGELAPDAGRRRRHGSGCQLGAPAAAGRAGWLVGLGLLLAARRRRPRI